MPQTQLLAEAARQLGQDRTATWCRWRQSELRHGFLRAELAPGGCARPAAAARSRSGATLVPGDIIALQERRPAAGTAVVTAGMHQAGS
ncbi:hypothetical protein ACFYXH_34285 [Streptomyces sp. NPDC002730]|uniref:hypothetical protein n=1 Tax=Streptomyces sp. NPDC002730 TaxID=3364662 RepID=UPI0036B67D1C